MASKTLLFVDDNIERENNQRIVAAARAKNIEVVSLTSTTDAILYLEHHPEMLSRPPNTFRVLSDMTRLEEGAQNRRAGLELLCWLQFAYSYTCEVMFYCQDIANADSHLELLSLGRVTNSESVAKDYACFEFSVPMLSFKLVQELKMSPLVKSSIVENVQRLLISRPLASDQSLAAKVFWNVESRFMSFVGIDKGKRYFRVKAVTAYRNEQVLASFLSEKAEMDHSLDPKKFIKPGAEKYLSHLHAYSKAHSNHNSVPILAWHGATRENVHSIIKEGVKMEHTGKLGKWHGKGFYCTTSPDYAEQYLRIVNAFNEGANCLLLCWVLVGTPYPVESVEMEGQTSAPQGYTSSYSLVANNYRASKVFFTSPEEAFGDELCTFKNARVLPAYYVEYERIEPTVLIASALESKLKGFEVFTQKLKKDDPLKFKGVASAAKRKFDGSFIHVTVTLEGTLLSLTPDVEQHIIEEIAKKAGVLPQFVDIKAKISGSIILIVEIADEVSALNMKSPIICRTNEIVSSLTSCDFRMPVRSVRASSFQELKQARVDLCRTLPATGREQKGEDAVVVRFSSSSSSSSSSSEKDQKASDDTCTICLELYNDANRCPMVSPCGHIGCAACWAILGSQQIQQHEKDQLKSSGEKEEAEEEEENFAALSLNSREKEEAEEEAENFIAFSLNSAESKEPITSNTLAILDSATSEQRHALDEKGLGSSDESVEEAVKSKDNGSLAVSSEETSRRKGVEEKTLVSDQETTSSGNVSARNQFSDVAMLCPYCQFLVKSADLVVDQSLLKIIAARKRYAQMQLESRAAAWQLVAQQAGDVVVAVVPQTEPSILDVSTNMSPPL